MHVVWRVSGCAQSEWHLFVCVNVFPFLLASHCTSLIELNNICSICVFVSVSAICGYDPSSHLDIVDSPSAWVWMELNAVYRCATLLGHSYARQALIVCIQTYSNPFTILDKVQRKDRRCILHNTSRICFSYVRSYVFRANAELLPDYT